jgi:transposase
MVSIVKRRIKGNLYHYAVRCQRVDGKPKIVSQVYLGRAQDIVDAVQKVARPPAELRLRPFPLGLPAAILRADDDLGLSRALERVAPNISLGKYVLLQIAGRDLRFTSRLAIDRHFRGSILSLLFPGLPHSYQTLLRRLDRLTPDLQRTVENDVFRALLARGVEPSLLLWDTTNVFTRIEAGEDLPRKGMSKDKRNDRNLVGVGLAVSESGVPLMHETFPGNASDSKVFSKLIDTLAARLEGLGLDPKSLVAVFDRGNNSQENIDALVQRLHLIGTVKQAQAKELLDVPLENFEKAFVNGREHVIRAYRTKAEFYGRQWTVVVAYNRVSARKQRKKFEQDMVKAKAGLQDLEERLKAPRGPGRPRKTRGVFEEAFEIIPKKQRSLFELKVTRPRGRARLEWSVREDRVALRQAGFGKHVIFTDREEWTSERIIRANFARTEVEEDFHCLKDQLIIPVRPIHVRKDGRIRAHVFLCVMSLVMWKYLVWRLRKEGVEVSSLKDLKRRLEGLQMVLVLPEGRRKGEFRVQELTAEERGLFEAIQMGDFVPN